MKKANTVDRFYSRFSKSVGSSVLFIVLILAIPMQAMAEYWHSRNTAAYTFNTVNSREGILHDTFFDSEHFEIEFPNNYTDGFKYMDTNQDNAPDEINRLVEVLESAWTKLQSMGYGSPRNVFNITQLYVVLDDQNALLDDNLAGFATVGEDANEHPTFPYIVLNAHWLFPEEGKSWTPDQEAENRKQFYATAVHELFHIFQFAYNPEFVYRYYDINFAEGSADWFTEVMFPDYDLYEETIGDYMGYPEYSLFGSVRPAN